MTKGAGEGVCDQALWFAQVPSIRTCSEPPVPLYWPGKGSHLFPPPAFVPWQPACSRWRAAVLPLRQELDQTIGREMHF